MFLLNYSNGPQQTDAAAYVVRTDLTRNLGTLAETMYREVIAAVDQGLSDKQGLVTNHRSVFVC